MLMTLSPAAKKALADLLNAGGTFLVKVVLDWILKENKPKGG